MVHTYSFSCDDLLRGIYIWSALMYTSEEEFPLATSSYTLRCLYLVSTVCTSLTVNLLIAIVLTPESTPRSACVKSLNFLELPVDFHASRYVTFSCEELWLTVFYKITWSARIFIWQRVKQICIFSTQVGDYSRDNRMFIVDFVFMKVVLESVGSLEV